MQDTPTDDTTTGRCSTWLLHTTFETRESSHVDEKLGSGVSVGPSANTVCDDSGEAEKRDDHLFAARYFPGRPAPALTNFTHSRSQHSGVKPKYEKIQLSYSGDRNCNARMSAAP